MKMLQNLMGVSKFDLKKTIPQPSPSETNGHDEKIYFVTKAYTPKRKDELGLPKGTVVCILDDKDGRYLVEAIVNKAGKVEQGWVPKFCLQTMEKSNMTNSENSK